MPAAAALGAIVRASCLSTLYTAAHVRRYDLGLISGALLEITSEFQATDSARAWIVGAAKAGACVGTFLGGAAMYKYGRTRTVGAASLFFIAGPLLMALATSITQLVLGRLVIGLGIGMSAVVIPAYIAEMAPAALRGAAVVAYEAMLCMGMLASLLVDAALSVRVLNVQSCLCSCGIAHELKVAMVLTHCVHCAHTCDTTRWQAQMRERRSREHNACMQDVKYSWRLMTGSPLVPALLLALSPWLLPESPRWLLMQGDLDSALAVLLRVNRTRVRFRLTVAGAGV